MMRYVRRAAISMRVRVISWFCRGLVHNFSRFIFEVCFGLSRARRRIPKDTRILRTRFLFFTNKTLLVNTERRVKRTSLKKLRLCR